MTQLSFNELDSFAYWNVPSNLTTNTDAQARENQFKDAYQENYFPMALLPTNLSVTLANMRYVLVGMNPGSAFDLPQKDTFLNFHGAINSRDYRLAAAIYETPLWGALMTDLSHKVDSHAENVTFNKQTVTNLEQHLDDLSVPANAKLVVLGAGDHYTVLKQYAHHLVVNIPHYSGANSHWQAVNSRRKVLTVTQE